MLQKILDWFKSLRSNAPVYSCTVYKRHGCGHKGAAGFVTDNINSILNLQ